jgi:transposase-like protein
MQIRKVIKNRGHFPNDEAATKLIWLALRNIAKKLENATHHMACRKNSVRNIIHRPIYHAPVTRP